MLLLRGAPVNESIQGQYGQPRHSARTSSRGEKLREALLTGTGQAAEGRVAHVPLRPRFPFSKMGRIPHGSYRTSVRGPALSGVVSLPRWSPSSSESDQKVEAGSLQLERSLVARWEATTATGGLPGAPPSGLFTAA